MNKYILGISCYFHDSAVCLLKNGKIISAVQEERFTGIKNDSSFPYRSIEWILKQNNIKIKDIDYVVFYEKPLKKFLRILNSSIEHFPYSRKYFISQMKRWLSEKIWTKTNIIKKIDANLKQIIFCQHHLSHAASVYFDSMINDSSIMVSDGVGEDQSFSIWKGINNKLSLLYEIKYPKSLGLFYSTMTSFLGHNVNDGENKVMSMAAYGNEDYYNKMLEVINLSNKNIFNQNFEFFKYQYSLTDNYSKKLVNLLGKPRQKENPFVDEYNQILNNESSRYANIAFATQRITEQIIKRKADLAFELYPSKNLCASGGVHLNCAANYNSLIKSKFTNVYINFCPSDSGGSIGAALWAWNTFIDTSNIKIKQNVFLGPDFTDDEIQTTLLNLDIKYEKFEDQASLLNATVEDLVSNKIIAWFQGKLEFGKRALGNRSILSTPTDKSISNKINKIIKKREVYQPFAASIIDRFSNKYFELDSKFNESYKYMNIIAKCKNEYLSKIKGVLHIDNSCRIQIVNKNDNYLFYQLIDSFYKKTNLPILLNTSFNLKGETIVDNPLKAISTFLRSKCDVLYLNKYKIVNNNEVN